MEYLVRDVHFGLRGNTVKISLSIEYMPIVGYFFKVRIQLFSQSYSRPPTECLKPIVMNQSDLRLVFRQYN